MTTITVTAIAVSVLVALISGLLVLGQLRRERQDAEDAARLRRVRGQR